MVSPITKKNRKQAGILFVDDTNLWEGLDEEDDEQTVMEKGQRSINGWGNNLLAVGGELRPDKCSYTVHKMRPTKDGERKYVQEKTVAPPSDETVTIAELEDLWEDMDDDELDDLEPPAPGLMISLVNGEAAAIKKLSNSDAEENLGMKVQPDGCSMKHLLTLIGKVED